MSIAPIGNHLYKTTILCDPYGQYAFQFVVHYNLGITEAEISQIVSDISRLLASHPRPPAVIPASPPLHQQPPPDPPAPGLLPV